MEMNNRCVEEGATVIGSIKCGIDVTLDSSLNNLGSSFVGQTENISSDSAGNTENVQGGKDKAKNDKNERIAIQVNGDNSVSKVNGISSNDNIDPKQTNDHGPSYSEKMSNGNQSPINPNIVTPTIKEEKKVEWQSRYIGNVMDGANNIVVPITIGKNSKNGSSSVTVKKINNNKALSNGKTQPRALSEMTDDFGNPLLPQRARPTNGFDLSKNTYSNNNFVDEFGNPLYRSANENELAGYRQIREISAVTREILDAHIQQKKKDAIEKKASKATPRGRLARQLDKQKKIEEDDNDGNEIPAFLR